MGKKSCGLLALRKQPGVDAMSEFCACIGRLDRDELADAYRQYRDHAPKRHCHGKKYFVGHSGFPGGGENSNRDEEHLAIALFNDFAKRVMIDHPEFSALRVLDYQLPLKAERADPAVGKVDLFAAIDDVHPCVAELKVVSDNGNSNTPLFAFLEALAYCAIVEANMDAIAAEAEEAHQIQFAVHTPRLMVLAPDAYWERYSNHPKSGDWQPQLQELASAIAERLGVRSHFAALCGPGFSKGSREKKPKLSGPYCLREAWR